MVDAVLERHWVSFEAGRIEGWMALVKMKLVVRVSGRRLRAHSAVRGNAWCFGAH